MGDFTSRNPIQLFESIYFNSFSHSPDSKYKTVIDIFHNNINENAIPGNLNIDISKHSAQFFITPTVTKIKMNPPKNTQ